MTRRVLPEIEVDRGLEAAMATVGGAFASIEEAETVALRGDIAAPLTNLAYWQTFSKAADSLIERHGYVVIRGLQADEGRSLLILGTIFRAAFDAYKPGKIVKRFRMSPWTSELSHTTRAGDFHTDGNVSPHPPVGTAIQCEQEDPGAPEFAEQRVVCLTDLLARLGSGDRADVEALRFLTDTEVVMGHERSPTVWRGRPVNNGTIRYHPHRLRMADARLQTR